MKIQAWTQQNDNGLKRVQKKMKNQKTENNKDNWMVTGDLENSNEVVDHRALINVK